VSERREFLRVPINAEVRFHNLQDGGEQRGFVKNISGSGILFSSEEIFEPGTLLNLEVAAPDLQTGEPQPLRATVRVVRVTGKEPPYELAAEFVQLDLP
jgi:c-di-GMP-binding flagellar brake protein YcgR